MRKTSFISTMGQLDTIMEINLLRSMINFMQEMDTNKKIIPLHNITEKLSGNIDQHIGWNFNS